MIPGRWVRGGGGGGEEEEVITYKNDRVVGRRADLVTLKCSTSEGPQPEILLYWNFYGTEPKNTPQKILCCKDWYLLGVKKFKARP